MDGIPTNTVPGLGQESNTYYPDRVAQIFVLGGHDAGVCAG